jgi:hypothetical protein
MTDYIEPKDVAKLVRKDLKRAFAGIKFSVRTKVYTGGSSIRVSWENGPTTEEVEKIAGHYKGAGFDPYQDMKTYNDEPYGNDYIFFNRDITEDHYIRMAEKVIKEYGIEFTNLNNEVVDLPATEALDYYSMDISKKLGTGSIRNFCYRILCHEALEDIPEKEEDKEQEEEEKEKPMYKEANTEFIEAAHKIIPMTLGIKIKMDPSEMQAFCKTDFDYNGYNNARIGEMCEIIDYITPKMNYAPGNPNNGLMHHNYHIGRENSMVLYIDIVKAYAKGYDWEEYDQWLESLAKEYQADEFYAIENNEHSFVYRMWWD